MNTIRALRIWKPTVEDKKWLPSVLYAKNETNAIVRVLRGKKIRNRQSFMDEIGAALQFFDGFGENWHAVKDCLCNLYDDKKFRRFVLVVSDADLAFKGHEDEWKWFIKICEESADYYLNEIADGDIFDRPSVKFELILECSDSEKIAIIGDNIAKCA